MLGLAAALEDLDDDHAATAARARCWQGRLAKRCSPARSRPRVTGPPKWEGDGAEMWYMTPLVVAEAKERSFCLCRPPPACRQLRTARSQRSFAHRRSRGISR